MMRQSATVRNCNRMKYIISTLHCFSDKVLLVLREGFVFLMAVQNVRDWLSIVPKGSLVMSV